MRNLAKTLHKTKTHTAYLKADKVVKEAEKILEESILKRQEIILRSFSEDLSVFFNKYPNLISFSWQNIEEYDDNNYEMITTYNSWISFVFNEGTEINDWADYETKDEDVRKELEDLKTDIESMLDTLKEEDHLDIFGENVTITVYQNRIEIN